jgi:hypothetical protein
MNRLEASPTTHSCYSLSPQDTSSNSCCCERSTGQGQRGQSLRSEGRLGPHPPIPRPRGHDEERDVQERRLRALVRCPDYRVRDPRGFAGGARSGQASRRGPRTQGPVRSLRRRAGSGSPVRQEGRPEAQGSSERTVSKEVRKSSHRESKAPRGQSASQSVQPKERFSAQTDDRPDAQVRLHLRRGFEREGTCENQAVPLDPRRRLRRVCASSPIQSRVEPSA